MNTVARSSVEQLLAEARRGEVNCLGKLLQYYGNYLKLLVTTHLDAKLRARCSPSDIVQESYFEAHRDFEKFQGQTAAEFLAWLRQILVNNMAREVEKHILSAKRDVRREVRLNGMQEALERSAARLESVFVDQASSPSSRLDRHEHVVELANHLAELPTDYREVLVLRHCEGLAFKDIARQMGRSAGAVRMLWLRAIGQIRQQMNARGTPLNRQSPTTEPLKAKSLQRTLTWTLCRAKSKSGWPRSWRATWPTWNLVVYPMPRSSLPGILIWLGRFAPIWQAWISSTGRPHPCGRR